MLISARLSARCAGGSDSAFKALASSFSILRSGTYACETCPRRRFDRSNNGSRMEHGSLGSRLWVVEADRHYAESRVRCSAPRRRPSDTGSTGLGGNQFRRIVRNTFGETARSRRRSQQITAQLEVPDFSKGPLRVRSDVSGNASTVF